MYVVPSTSVTVAPEPLATVYGTPPTDAKDRTGESTPPGSTAEARLNHASFVSATQGLGDLGGEVRDDDVSPRATDRRQVLERDRPAIDPATLSGGLHHRILAAHVVGSDRDIDDGCHVGDDVEAAERGLHHDDVRALVDVEEDL